jgi:hypothetical protein
MADEWRKHFFLIKISKMIIPQKKNFLSYFLAKNTTFVEQFFFNSKWRINQNGDLFYQFFEML